MTREEHHDLSNIVVDKPWLAHKRLSEYLKTVNVSEYEEAPKTPLEAKNGPPKRTSQQHRALFKWFEMIEREAENAGVTWNMVIKHTHQLRVTKETLHGMCKQLQQALWGTDSTKELKKTGNIDIIIDHFTDLFAKEGLELPPFPSVMPDYPEYDGPPTI